MLKELMLLASISNPITEITPNPTTDPCLIFITPLGPADNQLQIENDRISFTKINPNLKIAVKLLNCNSRNRAKGIILIFPPFKDE